MNFINGWYQAHVTPEPPGYVHTDTQLFNFLSPADVRHCVLKTTAETVFRHAVSDGNGSWSIPLRQVISLELDAASFKIFFDYL